MSRQQLLLDGNTLTPEDLLRLSRAEVCIDLTPESWARFEWLLDRSNTASSILSVERSRGVVTRILEGKDAVYGINTGFGNFAQYVASLSVFPWSNRPQRSNST